MKHTEQRWMHISTGLPVERGRKPDNSTNDYRTVTVTWDRLKYTYAWNGFVDGYKKALEDSKGEL